MAELRRRAGGGRRPAHEEEGDRVGDADGRVLACPDVHGEERVEHCVEHHLEHHHRHHR